jgi:hypothetical protein
LVFKNRKGQSFIPIIVIIIIVLVVFALVNIVVGQAFTEINTALMEDDSLSNTSKAVTNNFHNQYGNIVDGSFLMVLVLLFVLGMLAAYASASNPVFILIAIVLMIIIVVLGLLLSNIYEDVVRDDDFGDVAVMYPATDWTLTHFGTVALVMVASMVLTMFISNRSGQ